MKSAEERAQERATHEELRRLATRSLVPRELKGAFKTSDGTVYQRDPQTRTIRLAGGKVRGKKARRAEKKRRRLAREHR